MVIKDIKYAVNAGDIFIHKVPLGGFTRGFTYLASDDTIHIFISDCLSPEREMKTLKHECIHAIKHIGQEIDKEIAEKEAIQFSNIK